MKENNSTGLYVKKDNFFENPNNRENLGKMLGEDILNNIDSYLSDVSEGREVKLEPVYRNGVINQIKVVYLQGQKKSELDAMKVENLLRIEQGLNERASYEHGRNEIGR